MEKKIIIKKNLEHALYLFKRDDEVEFVVGYMSDPSVKVGDEVSGWYNGTYFYNIEDALKYLKTIN